MKCIRAAAAIVACVLLCAATASAEQKVIFLVRHAERADTPSGKPPAGMMANDPPLSAAGKQRAEKLAALLASAGIRHIFTTEYQRTRQTATPLAEQLKVTPVIAPAKEPDPLIEQIARAEGNVLIVGHSNTLPDLIERLGVTERVSIPESQYGDLFIVVKPETGEATLIRLRF